MNLHQDSPNERVSPMDTFFHRECVRMHNQVGRLLDTNIINIKYTVIESLGFTESMFTCLHTNEGELEVRELANATLKIIQDAFIDRIVNFLMKAKGAKLEEISLHTVNSEFRYWRARISFHA